MKNESVAGPQPHHLAGWINGFVAILMFSGSMPATRVAVLEMPALFLTVSRAGIAGVLAVASLLLFRAKRPTKVQMKSIVIVAAGVVLGFPLLSAIALQYMTSARSLVFVGLIPLSTALFAVIRGGERPHPRFWLFAVLGSLLVVGFALTKGGSASLTGDALMLVAVVVCGLGYAEGAVLSKALAGWEVISWALVISIPVSIVLVFMTMPEDLSAIRLNGWVGLGYVGLFSQFLGFVFWYRGLAQGGIAAVGQLQLLQTFFGLGIAALLLHEQVSMGMVGVCACVIACVAASRRLAR